MKILFWETDVPKDRITLSVIALVPLSFVGRAIVVSSGEKVNPGVGAVHPVRHSVTNHYLTDASLYAYGFVVLIIWVLISIIAINSAKLALIWFKRNHSRDVF